MLSKNNMLSYFRNILNILRIYILPHVLVLLYVTVLSSTHLCAIIFLYIRYIYIMEIFNHINNNTVTCNNTKICEGNIFIIYSEYSNK
jgi:hypothetical protein